MGKKQIDLNMSPQDYVGSSEDELQTSQDRTVVLGVYDNSEDSPEIAELKQLRFKLLAKNKRI